MKLFRKSSAAQQPQLLRLSVLEEGADNSTPGLRLSVASACSELDFESLLMEQQKAGTPKTRRGFPFPWLGRKNSAPKKYAVNPAHDDTGATTLIRSAVSQLSLDDYTDHHQWPKSFRTFRKSPQPPPRQHHKILCHDEVGSGRDAFPSSESLNNNNYLNNNHLIDPDGAMYRSVSTSALFDDNKQIFRRVEIDPEQIFSPRAEDLTIDPRLDPPPDGAAVALGTVPEEEAFLPADDVRSAPDTDSLASSIQHRSDESGYESDGKQDKDCLKEPPVSPVLPSPPTPDGNGHKLAALFHRLTGGSRKDDSAESLCKSTGKSHELRTKSTDSESSKLSNSKSHELRTKSTDSDSSKSSISNSTSKSHELRTKTDSDSAKLSNSKSHERSKSTDSNSCKSSKSHELRSLFGRSDSDSGKSYKSYDVRSLFSKSDCDSASLIKSSTSNSHDLKNVCSNNDSESLGKSSTKSRNLFRKDDSDSSLCKSSSKSLEGRTPSIDGPESLGNLSVNSCEFRSHSNKDDSDSSSKSSTPKCHEARSLRLRTPAMLSNFVQRHSRDISPSVPSKGLPTSPLTPTEDVKKEVRPSSRLGQFKAWTLDRKLLRSRWKKTSLPDDRLDITPTQSRRSSIFQSSLFPSSTEDSPVSHHRHLETKSLPSLSSVADSPSCDPLSSSSTFGGYKISTEGSPCGGLNYQIRLKKAGYKSGASTSTSTNNTRRRLWLQSQLSTSDCEDALSPEPPSDSRKSFVTTPPPPSSAPPRRLPSQLDLHELVSVDLRKDEHGELGIYITGCTDAVKDVLGYIIVDLEKDGPADRSGKLLRGDELLIVNGQQLQGVSLEEARRMLRVPESEMHLLLARELTDDLCFKEADPSRLPPVPELHETHSSGQSVTPRLRHWTSDVSHSKSDNRHSNPVMPEKMDNERMGSNGVCTLPRRPKHQSAQLSLHTAVFEKGPGRKSLGFSIVGGRDSPRGELGFFVKTVFAGGQAAETGALREGDEIYTLNGQTLQGLSHSEAIAAFKKIKQGPVVLHIGRRTNKKSTSISESSSKLESNNSKSCSTLDNI